MLVKLPDFTPACKEYSFDAPYKSLQLPIIIDFLRPSHSVIREQQVYDLLLIRRKPLTEMSSNYYRNLLDPADQALSFGVSPPTLVRLSLAKSITSPDNVLS